MAGEPPRAAGRGSAAAARHRECAGRGGAPAGAWCLCWPGFQEGAVCPSRPLLLAGPGGGPGAAGAAGDRCAAAVLGTAGALSPPRFSCALSCGQFSYTHFRTRSPGRYRLRLQIRYDSPRRTLAVPFTLEAEVLFQQLRLLTRNPVEKLRALSAPCTTRCLASPRGSPAGAAASPCCPPRPPAPCPPPGGCLASRSGPCPPAAAEAAPPCCKRPSATGTGRPPPPLAGAATASSGRDGIPARVSVLPAPGRGEQEYYQHTAQAQFSDVAHDGGEPVCSHCPNSGYVGC